jgi:hypothetical protein
MPDEMRRGARRSDLTTTRAARGVRAIRAALSEGPLPRSELREHLLAERVDVLRDPQTLIHLIAYAASQGVIVVLPPVGRHNRFALLDDWIPATAPTRDAAEAELARRYFSSFSPATIADFRAWAGVPMPLAQRATALIRSELDEADVPLPGLLRMRTDHPPAAATSRSPTVRLLPRWDTYVLGYRSRDLMLHPAHVDQVCIGSHQADRLRRRCRRGCLGAASRRCWVAARRDAVSKAQRRSSTGSFG